MFMLKSLFGKIWSDQNNAELVQLPSGSLYLIRPNSQIQNSRECIYNDCIATIRRTTIPFSYQLVITRAYQEGEEDLLDENELKEDDERSFLIDQSLKFREEENQNDDDDEINHSFVWNDLIDNPNQEGGDDDDGDCFEFVCDGKSVNNVTRSIFELTFLQCVYERKFERSHDDATEEELAALKYQSNKSNLYPSTSKIPKSSLKSKASNPEDLSKQLENLSVTKSSTSSPSNQKKKVVSKQKAEAFNPEPKPAPKALEIPNLPGESKPETKFQTSADLYLYDQGTGLFMNQEKNVPVEILEAGRFLYWFSIQSPSKGSLWLSQSLNSNMNLSFARDSLSSVWNYFDPENGNCYSWLLRFSDFGKYNEFQENCSKFLWEVGNEERWVDGKSGKPADQRYLQQAYEEDSPMDVDEEELTEEELAAIEASEVEHQSKSQSRSRSNREYDYRLNDVNEEDEDEVAQQLEEEEEDEEEEEEEEDEVDQSLLEGMPRINDKNEVNSQLAVGYKFDRSFVVRGERIGVFKHTDDDRLEFSTTIDKVKTTKGKQFAPKKIMLHDQDSSMILQDPSNSSSLYKMDLEYGKIVEEWNIHPDVPVENFLPSNKYAQMTSEQTLIGTSHNSIYRIDPRVNGNKLVDEQFKQYVSKNQFSSAATDDKGRLAVASEKGDIRLFDSIGKNAKTALPALGDPILGVDVTADGRYIIATCKTYLLLIDTLIGDGRYKGNLGFDRSFPADSKPIPRRLQLKPHHVAYMEQPVSFTPARFNVGDNDETSIVTSSGPFVVTFDLNKIKRGNLSAYSLVKLSDTVVQDQYGYGSEGKRIVVAMASDVQMTKKNQLKKPTRESLTAQPYSRKSRGGGIVDERY